MHLTRRFAPAEARQRGLSLIELLVGITVGLFLLTGALRFFSDYVNDNRRLLIETRMNQDLRTIADLISRDLRRAGFWQDPLRGVTAPSLANPYSAISPAGAASSATVTYSYSRDATENNSLGTNERFGFRLQGGAVEAMDAGGTWRQLSDPALMTVSNLAVTPQERCVSLSRFCSKPNLADACTTAGAAYPRLLIRRYQVDIAGRSTREATIVRQVSESVRVRNDQIVNSLGCPP